MKKKTISRLAFCRYPKDGQPPQTKDDTTSRDFLWPLFLDGRERKSSSISTIISFLYDRLNLLDDPKVEKKKKIIPHTQALVTSTKLKASIALSTRTWPAGHFPFFIITICKRRENSGHETGRNESDRIRWCPAVEKLRTWLTIDLKEKRKEIIIWERLTYEKNNKRRRKTWHDSCGLLRRFLFVCPPHKTKGLDPLF